MKKSTKPSKKKSVRQQKPFRFLELPQELRDYIYELALVDHQGIAVVPKFTGHRRTVRRGVISVSLPRLYRDDSPIEVTSSSSNDLVPNLLAVSKQIRAEASGYLYKQRITLMDTATLHTFLAAIGPSNREILSHLIVKGWGEGRGAHKTMNHTGLTLLSSCANLRKLHLDCDIGYHRSPKWLARQIFRDGHHFLEAYGAANGKKDAAIDVLELHPRNFETRFLDGPGVRSSAKSNPEHFKELFHKELRTLLRSN